MVSPLGQRMVFQTAHNEAARVAHDIATQLQREESFKKNIADRMTEDDKGVRTVPKSEQLKTEEQQERRKQFAKQSNESDENDTGEDNDGKPKERASIADGRLDFLA